jgi:hypothetical protein
MRAEPRPCGGASCFPRHRRGAALLNDERPATREANGSRALLGEVFDPASRGAHAPARRARDEAAERRASSRRPAPGEPGLLGCQRAGDQSASRGTDRAHGCITPHPDGDYGRVEPANLQPQARTPTRRASATHDRTEPQGLSQRWVNPDRRARRRSRQPGSGTRSSSAQITAGATAATRVWATDERDDEAVSNGLKDIQTYNTAPRGWVL